MTPKRNCPHSTLIKKDNKVRYKQSNDVKNAQSRHRSNMSPTIKIANKSSKNSPITKSKETISKESLKKSKPLFQMSKKSGNYKFIMNRLTSDGDIDLKGEPIVINLPKRRNRSMASSCSSFNFKCTPAHIVRQKKTYVDMYTCCTEDSLLNFQNNV